MRYLVTAIEFPELDRFKRLHYTVMDVFSTILNEYLEPTQQMIRNLIAIEDAYINVNNPDFILARDATLNIFKKKQDPPSEEGIFQRHDGHHTIFNSNQREEMKMEERKRHDDEDSTSGKFVHMEKPNEIAEKIK